MAVLLELAPERIERDYDSFFKIPRPERSAALLDSLLRPSRVDEGKIVYGHFFPVKYLGAAGRENVRLVTILRDPIERLRSHFLFWRAGSFPDHYLWRRMTEERWTLEDFAFSDEMRNFYCQYLAFTAVGDFAFIGLCENLEHSVARCLDVLEVARPHSIRIPRENVAGPGPDVELTPSTRERLRAFHADDYALYEFARRRFHR